MRSQDAEKTDFDSTHFWGRRLEEWDSMFSEIVDPTRVGRMDAIIDALSSHSLGPSRILEIGSGPGPLASRVLTRFSSCRVVAVDTDPVLIEVGRRALARFGARIS